MPKVNTANRWWSQVSAVYRSKTEVNTVMFARVTGYNLRQVEVNYQVRDVVCR